MALLVPPPAIRDSASIRRKIQGILSAAGSLTRASHCGEIFIYAVDVERCVERRLMMKNVDVQWRSFWDDFEGGCGG
jgi:hypothetical protein